MIALDGLDLDTAPFAIREGFDFLTAVRESELVQRPIGASLIRGGKREPVTLEIPMWATGVAGGGKTAEDKVLEAIGKIGEKREKAEAMAGLGGMPGTVKLTGATNTSDLTIMQIEVIAPKVDLTHITANKVAFSIKLTIQPLILGPEYKAAEGRKPQGLVAADITITGAKGDIPGPARIVVKNEGTVSQQFAMLGLQWRDGVSGNKLLLTPDTFDVSTAPLNGTYTAGTNEVQTATKSGTISGGSFTLTYEGATTTSLAHNASTATVKSALEALSTIGTGNINVTGSALSAGNMVFTFQGSLAATDTSLIVLNSSLTGGGTAPITQTTQGVQGYVANTSLQPVWSDFTRTAAQTDAGSYDLWALVQTDADANYARIRATVSVGDPSRGVINRSASIPAKGVPVLVNLGPAHVNKRQSAGSHKWTVTFSAMTVGTTGTYCRILGLVKVPTEHGARSARVSSSGPPALVLSDDFNQTTGNATGKTLSSGQTWSGGGDADDFGINAGTHQLERSAVSDASGTGRELYAGSSVVEVSATIAVLTSSPMFGGPQIRRSGSNTRFFVRGSTSPGLATFEICKQISGTVTVIGTWAGAVPFPTGVWLSALSNGYWEFSATGAVDASGVDSDLATGGALASGTAGIYENYTSSTAATRRYDMFRAYRLPDTPAEIFPSRRLQWQNDGSLEREASGGTDYAYAQGQQGAGIPMLGPAGSESINNRLLIASADFNPDVAASGNPAAPLSYEVYHRPAYLLGRWES